MCLYYLSIKASSGRYFLILDELYWICLLQMVDLGGGLTLGKPKRTLLDCFQLSIFL